MFLYNYTKERYIKIPANLANLASTPKNTTGQNVFAAFLFWSAPIYIGADQNGESARVVKRGSRH
jgi:hypothetical protein